MTVYEKGRFGDEEEILDLANYVFSQSARPHDFAVLLPKVYAPGRAFADIHYVARQDGRIRAQVALQPLTLRIGEHTLQAGYVGTVSSHPRARGEGHMKGCMAALLADARARGLDVLSLGGQRQRYQYFGFERGGQQIAFSLDHANVRHALADVDCADVAFAPLAESDVKSALALHDKQAISCQRSVDGFLTVLRSWQGEAFAIRRGGAFAGYLYARGNDIPELRLENEDDLYGVLKAWLAFRAVKGARVLAYPHEPSRVRALDALCEYTTVADDGMYAVLNWRRVLAALLTLKNAACPLAYGRAVLEVQGVCRLEIIVNEDGVTVRDTDAAPDVSLPALQAQRLALSPLTALAPAPKALGNWFPLFLNIPVADQF